MNVSYKWLQSYFKEPLPEVKELAEVLTFGAFEIEGVERVGDDWMIDVDVLPNRAHDCLGHRGIAKEIGVLLQLPLKVKTNSKLQIQNSKTDLEIDVQEPNLCRRYVGRKLNNIKVGASPDWLKEQLEAIGQKSINNIVDATNYVMFDLGQPLHAFDADKLDGGIIVRKAVDGEQITTLDEKEVELNDKVLLIADEKDPLAIAGIKGGNKAEVDNDTVNLVLEAANFEPSNIRKTTRLVNIQTDSSKRFENEITPEFAGMAMEELTALILEIAGTDNTEVEEPADTYPRKVGEYKIGVSSEEINKLLGANISEKQIENILERFGFSFEKIVPIEKIKKIIDGGELIGKEYKSGASVTNDAPDIFDCSSLSAWIYKEAGIAIPRISVDQFVFTERINEEDLVFGDLIFSNSGIVLKTGIHEESVEFLPGTVVEDGVDHLGIYLGDGKILHTSSQTKAVVIEDFDKAEMFKNIVGYGRVPNLNEERYVVTVPTERLDLRIKEDLIEEIGRVYGYANIKGVPLDFDCERVINKRLFYMNRIREVLQNAGYSENYGYTFRAKGDIEMLKSMAQGKDFLRTNLTDGMQEALEFNDRYKDLLAIDRVRMFEFGSVFTKDKEWMSFSIGLGPSKQKGEEDVLELLNKELDTNLKADIFGKQGGVFEIDFDALVGTLPGPTDTEVTESDNQEIQFKTISPYPFITRDIAVWVSSDTLQKEFLELIRDNAGEWLVQNNLFDIYARDAKTSIASRLVFQSQDKTLTDDEINPIMEKITKEMENKGWEVR
ncbi:phenylalanine--tRNA ligase beta subunit-related protein [Patescibacteria group bacterium]